MLPNDAKADVVAATLAGSAISGTARRPTVALWFQSKKIVPQVGMQYRHTKVKQWTISER